MIDIFSTTDYRFFVSDSLHAAGHARAHLATALDRSPAWVTMILKGERELDPELVEPLMAFLGLEGAEATYFSALVDLHSRSTRARRTAWATVQATQAHRASSTDLDADTYTVFSRWYYGAITELAACEGFRADPRWIASMIGAITEAEAAEALTLLVRLEQLEPDDTGQLVRKNDATWSASNLPPGKESEALQALHRGHLEQAATALQTVPGNERHCSVSTMSLSEAHYERVQARVRELERELVLLVLEDPDPPNRVFHLGLQLFPVSNYTDTDPEPHST